MRKTMYVILAVLIASGITVLQVIIARSASTGQSFDLYVAAEDIEKGTVLEYGHLKKIVMNEGRDMEKPEETNIDDLVGSAVSDDIEKGQIITEGCVSAVDDSDDYGCVALKVDGGNFNAGSLKKGDTVDIFFIPDFDKLEDSNVVWMNEALRGSSRFIKGKQPGILIEGLLIEHIETTAGNQAEYVSVRAPRKVDEVIAYLEHISVYEFIAR